MNNSNDALIMIGGRIKTRRAALGISQKELAKIAQVDPSLLSRYESGDVEPKAMNLSQLAGALGVSVDWLLGLDENPRPVPELVGDELELLSLYRDMPNLQNKILGIVRMLNEAS
jgi:transcriptional regulator with XRE-family HTH domain